MSTVKVYTYARFKFEFACSNTSSTPVNFVAMYSKNTFAGRMTISENANYKGCNFEEVDLSGAKIVASFFGCIFDDVDFSGANMTGSLFMNCTFVAPNFAGATMACKFKECIIKSANCIGTNTTGIQVVGGRFGYRSVVSTIASASPIAPASPVIAAPLPQIVTPTAVRPASPLMSSRDYERIELPEKPRPDSVPRELPKDTPHAKRSFDIVRKLCAIYGRTMNPNDKNRPSFFTMKFENHSR